ncbi:MAG: hypothetical protein ACRC0I_11555 [Sediminibacterium sp.]|jgi:hypothetical protein|nr:hypothetical protein [Chitinophagaceae bacterium]MCA6448150.1 hypothetical protein [Chitinophagaceae bacterium]
MHKQVASIVQCFFSCITSGSSKQNGKIYQHLARKNLQDKRGVVEKIILMSHHTIWILIISINGDRKTAEKYLGE